MQMRGMSGLPLDEAPGSGAGDWFPAATGAHRPSKTIGTTAELEKRPDSIQLFSPSSETGAAASDPILGGELVIRVIDAQVSSPALHSADLTKQHSSYQVESRNSLSVSVVSLISASVFRH